MSDRCSHCGPIDVRRACPSVGTTRGVARTLTLTWLLVLAAVSHAAAQPGGMPDHDAGDPMTTDRVASIHAFGQVDFTRQPNGLTAFAVGQLDLFATAQLGDRIHVLTETVLEADDSNAYGVDVERLMLTFDVHPRLRLGIGRYHTAIGYYNTAYHHGAWFQTAATRPLAFRFEDDDGVLPVHEVGLSATGTFTGLDATWRWTGEIGNGHPPRGGAPVQNVTDADRGKAVNIALTGQPERWPGAHLGASFFNDWFDYAPGLQIHQQVVSVHAVWRHGPLEWLNEGAWISNRIAGGARTITPTGYVQFTREVGGVRPFARFEWRQIAPGDPVLQSPRTTVRSAGLRRELGPMATLKAQYDHERR